MIHPFAMLEDDLIEPLALDRPRTAKVLAEFVFGNQRQPQRVCRPTVHLFDRPLPVEFPKNITEAEQFDPAAFIRKPERRRRVRK